MNQITQTAPTKEEAINIALEKLGVTRQEVSITIVDEGKKGFFGFGAKPAVVQVTVLNNEEEKIEKKVEVENTEILEVAEDSTTNVVSIGEIEYTEGTNDHAIEEATQYIHEIAREMNIDDLTIDYRQEGKFIHLHLNSKKAALLIGKRGQTLNALENLTQLVANKFSNSFMIIKVDVGNYRERRKETLEQLADRIADKVVSTGKKEKLEPMSSYERKIIHNALSTRLDIETYSVGTDPNRYLVIEPIK